MKTRVIITYFHCYTHLKIPCVYKITKAQKKSECYIIFFLNHNYALYLIKLSILIRRFTKQKRNENNNNNKTIKWNVHE